MTNLANLQTQELINELRDRGFVVWEQEEAEEIESDLKAGEVMIGLIAGLNSSIECQSDELSLKIIESLIFFATGEKTEIELVVKEAA